MNVRIILYSLLLFGCTCLSAQTKFAGVVIDQSYTTFCTELSQKYKLAPGSKILKPDGSTDLRSCKFQMTFLGIEDCHMNVYSKDGITNKVHELEIVMPTDVSVESYGERGLRHFVIGTQNFKHIFEIYKTKYGNKYEFYVREGKAWNDIIVEWKLPDIRIVLQISKSNYGEDETYHSTRVFYFVEKNNTYKSTTIDDI